MIRTPCGYVLHSTHGHLEARTSADRVHFTRAGSAFRTPPSWWRAYSPGDDPRAPGISRRGGRYLMYYAVSSFGSNHSAIGLATSRTGQPGSWTDQGVVANTRSMGSSLRRSAGIKVPSRITHTSPSAWVSG
ncbi:hypothetical protein E1286_39270 [Nonomuraea terrae]|uniref:Arabinan endo-1,5-alpha-L-arabinosidase n=2 Tax=Nonomuraea terrae TaxID=2530383 RepID=A0A4R4XWK0_9ACTN|nr:hypothetical protein E1286_39270 [Nonomuraea terrae]